MSEKKKSESTDDLVAIRLRFPSADIPANTRVTVSAETAAYLVDNGHASYAKS